MPILTQLSQARWNIVFLGNTLLEYLTAFGLFILFLIVFRIFQKLILNRLKKIARKTKTDVDDVLIEAIQSLKR